ncbi:MAG: hypothetical protein WDN46_23525 [Methylocella sp.]
MDLSQGGAKYGDVTGQVLSSSRREWSGLYAESNVHVDCHLSPFVQQTTEVVLAVRASGIVTCCVDGLVQKANVIT